MAKRKNTNVTSGTKALMVLEENNIEYQLVEYDADAHSAQGYALDGAEKLGIEPRRVFKTLIAEISGLTARGNQASNMVIAVVPANATLNLKRLASQAGGKNAQMADLAKAQRVTGYVAGGISPLGTKTALNVFIDQSANELDQMLVSAGKRGHSIVIVPNELVKITNAKLCDIADFKK